jgi:hypothetical protein
MMPERHGVHRRPTRPRERLVAVVTAIVTVWVTVGAAPAAAVTGHPGSAEPAVTGQPGSADPAVTGHLASTASVPFGSAAPVLMAGAAPVVRAGAGHPALPPLGRDVDVDALVTAALGQLADSPVALLGDPDARADALAEVARDARSRGITLWIIAIGDASLTQADTDAVAERIRNRQGGTVIALSPRFVAVFSDEVDTDAQQAAADAAGRAGGDVAAARAAVDSLTATGFPWLPVIIAVIAAVLIAAVAGGLWEKRRRSRADAGALAALTTALADRVGALAPAIVRLSDQVDLLGRADVTDRFNQASSDYNTLRDELGTPLPSRRAVTGADRRVSELEATVTELTATADAALAPRTGPTGAGPRTDTAPLPAAPPVPSTAPAPTTQPDVRPDAPPDPPAPGG